jgi:hypothetical protein
LAAPKSHIPKLKGRKFCLSASSKSSPPYLSHKFPGKISQSKLSYHAENTEDRVGTNLDHNFFSIFVCETINNVLMIGFLKLQK